MPGFNSIDGLNSGLNTTEMVDAIMQFERRSAVLLEIQQSKKQIVITAYQALQSKFLSLNANLGILEKKSTFEKYSVDISDDQYLTAVADGRVGTGTYDIQVLDTAKNHQVASVGFESPDASLFGTGTITIQLGNGSIKTIEIGTDNNTLKGIKDAINEANSSINASLVNDGSSTNANRLILTGNKTGLTNTIKFTSNLTGGSETLNFTSTAFDFPENLSVDSGTTSQLSLGATASYTGSTNKIFTFTVKGTGTQTVGTDIIQIDWTDGVNSGSDFYNTADTEVTVVGADGMTLTLSAGVLNAGDTFQVQSFAPTLQEATNAKIAIGSTSGAGSPIVITSESNVFTNVVENLSITVKEKTEAGKTINLKTDIDIEAIKSSIISFIKSYNDVNKYIDSQNTYGEDSSEVPALLGDFTVLSLQSALQSSFGSKIEGINSQYNQMYSIGIRTKSDGALAIVNNTRFEEALRENLDDVIKLFTSSANSSHRGIVFLSSSPKTRAGIEFEVDITKAATHGGYKGSEITDPASTPIVIGSTNNTLKLNMDGLLSDEITLTEKTYSSYAELVTELQTKIDNDDKLGGKGISVEWIDSGAGKGYLEFKSSTYGSKSKIELNNSITNSAYTALGLISGSKYYGDDVEGTINGEEAEGVGQILKGKEDNKYTEGLQLKITLDASQLSEIVAEGKITVTKGVAARQREKVNNFTDSSTGIIDSRINSLKKQIEFLTARVEDIDERLAQRRTSLYKQFFAMEEALGLLNSTSSFLTLQLASINNNWNLIKR